MRINQSLCAVLMLVSVVAGLTFWTLDVLKKEKAETARLDSICYNLRGKPQHDSYNRYWYCIVPDKEDMIYGSR